MGDIDFDISRLLEDVHEHMGDDHDHDHDHMGEHDHHAHEALTAAEIKTFKIVFIFVFLLITYVGVLPTAIGSCRNSKACMSFMNCFSAGVFLSIALIHLFPEGSSQFDEWAMDNGYGHPFPMFYTLSFVGYNLALMVDRVIFA